MQGAINRQQMPRKIRIRNTEKGVFVLADLETKTGVEATAGSRRKGGLPIGLGPAASIGVPGSSLHGRGVPPRPCNGRHAETKATLTCLAECVFNATIRVRSRRESRESSRQRNQEPGPDPARSLVGGRGSLGWLGLAQKRQRLMSPFRLARVGAESETSTVALGDGIQGPRTR
jgi:hypothetical protein